MLKTFKTIKHKKGFTLLELLVSISIFAFMTTLLVAKYGTFNQGILLKNLAYDVALTIRNAQSYGLNVRSAPTADARYSGEFNLPYGVYFNMSSAIDRNHPALNVPYNKEIIFFVDRDGNDFYSGVTEDISVSTIKRGSQVYSMCVGADSTDCVGVDNNFKPEVSVLFKRPNPNAIISTGPGLRGYTYFELRLLPNDLNQTKMIKVIVYGTGQISVK